MSKLHSIPYESPELIGLKQKEQPILLGEQLILLNEFLRKIKTMVDGQASLHLKHLDKDQRRLLTQPRVFISHALEANLSLLHQLIDDLIKAGFIPLCNIQRINGNYCRDQTLLDLQDSQYVLLTGTRQYAERTKFGSHDKLRRELDSALKKAEKSTDFILPLMIEGDYSTIFPGVSKFLIQDCRSWYSLKQHQWQSLEDYIKTLTQSQPLGILPRLLGLNRNDDYPQYRQACLELYQSLQEILMRELKFLRWRHLSIDDLEFEKELKQLRQQQYVKESKYDIEKFMMQQSGRKSGCLTMEQYLLMSVGLGIKGVCAVSLPFIQGLMTFGSIQNSGKKKIDSHQDIPSEKFLMERILPHFLETIFNSKDYPFSILQELISFDDYSSNANTDELDEKIEKYLSCPITYKIMKEPVTTFTGLYTYERRAIEEWFKVGRETEPMTGQTLRNLTLRPNKLLLTAISDFDTLKLEQKETENNLKNVKLKIFPFNAVIKELEKKLGQELEKEIEQEISDGEWKKTDSLLLQQSLTPISTRLMTRLSLNRTFLKYGEFLKELLPFLEEFSTLKNKIFKIEKEKESLYDRLRFQNKEYLKQNESKKNNECKLNKSSSVNFFRNDSIYHDKDGLGLPLLDLTIEKNYNKIIKIVSERLKINEFIIKKGIFLYTSATQLAEIKNKMTQDIRRTNFLKLNEDYIHLENALLEKFHPYELKNESSDYISTNKLLTRQLFASLKYLIEMAIAKYPHWLRKNTLKILNLINKMGANIISAKFEQNFSVIKSLIKSGEEYSARNLNKVNQSGNGRYSIDDIELYQGYLSLIAENLQYFPDIIQKNKLIQNTSGFIIQLDKFFDETSDDNDLALCSFLEYKRNIKQRFVQNICDEFAINQIYTDQIQVINETLKKNDLDDKTMRELTANRERLILKQEPFMSRQKKLENREGAMGYQQMMQKKAVIIEGLELQKQLLALRQDFVSLNNKISLFFITDSIIKIDDSLREILNRLLDKMVAQELESKQVGNLSNTIIEVKNIMNTILEILNQAIPQKQVSLGTSSLAKMSLLTSDGQNSFMIEINRHIEQIVGLLVKSIFAQEHSSNLQLTVN